MSIAFRKLQEEERARRREAAAASFGASKPQFYELKTGASASTSKDASHNKRKVMR